MKSLGCAEAARERRKPWRPLPAAALLGAALLAAAGPAVGQGNTWREPSSLSIPRRLLAAASDGERIYTFGGCGSPCYAPPLHTSTTEERRVEVYDGQNWTIKNRIPAIVFGAAAAAGDDHRIYLFGGFLTGNALWQYTPTTDSWSRKANLPTPRFGLAAVALNGKIYVLGGSDGTRPSRALEVYDPHANSWETKTPMPTARVFLGAAALGNKIYAVGGSPDCCGNSVTSALEIYDPATDRWTSGAPLPVAQQVSAAAGSEGKIFTFGGFIPGVGVQGATFEYDPARNAWTARAAMPLARDQAPAVVFGGQVHVLGGSVDCHCQALATHQSYTPDREQPPLKADLEIVKSDHGVTEVIAGHSVGYQIDVTNHGPKAVFGAAVRDPFPTKLKNPTWSCAPVPGTPTGRCSPTGNGSIVESVDLPVGAKVHYEVSGTIDEDASGTIENVATVEPPSNIDDPDRSNNRSVDRNSIVCGSLPRITKSDDRGVVAPGDMPLYRIVVSNDCPTPVTVTVTDDLLASGLEAVRWCRGVGCEPSTSGKLTDTVAVPAHGSVTYQATGTVPCEPSEIVNRACVQASDPPAVCATDVDRIEPKEADLSVALTGPAVVSRGGQADYQVDIHNAGPCPATGVRIEFPPPGGFAFSSASAPCGNGFPCQIDDSIAAGADVRVTASFEVPEDAACATVPANVHITSSRDPNGANDSASVATRVKCPPGITKTDGLVTAPPGATLTYTITVTNPDVAESLPVRVMDAFPAELQPVTWCLGVDCLPSHGGDLDEDHVVVPAGGSTVYRAQGRVSCLFSGTVANTATASTLGLPAIQVSATDETLIVPDLGVTGCCAGIDGVFLEGQEIVYTFVLWNGGPAVQNDNPGPEFEDMLPPGLTLLGMTATSGTATTFGNTASWNGSLLVGENVILRVTAKIDPMTAGMTICNQGTFHFDADGDGTNESSGVTDDPFLPGDADPCCIRIAVGIPTLNGAGLAALVLLVCCVAVWRLRTPGTNSVACRRETPRRPARRYRRIVACRRETPRRPAGR